jgi:hypothetical protein
MPWSCVVEASGWILDVLRLGRSLCACGTGSNWAFNVVVLSEANCNGSGLIVGVCGAGGTEVDRSVEVSCAVGRENCIPITSLVNPAI